MKPVARSLALAAALAAAAPAAARAWDEPRPPAPPAYGDPGAPRAAHDRDGWRDHDRDGDRWRGRDGWRARELERVRAELAALDARRAEFYRWNAGRPGKCRKFDRWYAAERAELERRWNALAWYAWR